MTAISAGRLLVDLYHDGRKICDVRPALSRPSDRIGALLMGRDADQSVELLGMLFSICSVAHRVAATRALEAVRQQRVESQAERVRSCQVAAERLRETVMRLLLDWHYPCEDDAAAARAIRLCMQLNQALETGPAETQLAVIELGNWWRALRCRRSEQEAWIADHCERWQGIKLGSAGKVLEPGCSEAALSRFETGPVASAVGFTDAAQVVGAALGALVNQVNEALLLLEGERSESLQRLSSPGNSGGIGWALTARGWLMHEIELDGDRVASWQILAPTDRNFHTAGALTRRLRNVEIGRDQAEALVRDLTLAIDPCVAFEVRMNDA